MLPDLLDSLQRSLAGWRQRRDALALWDRVNPIEPGTIPESFNPLDPLHFQYAAEIAGGFGDALENETSPWSQCMFRPETELPYSKHLIRRALQYLGTSPQTPPGMINSIGVATIHLESFVPSVRLLPTDPAANLTFARSRGWL